MPSFGWKVGLPLALGLACAAVSQAALAQFFFRPYAYSYSHQIPDEDEPAFASRRAVASILGREGFRLIGPLGHRGEQIVATGVNRREGEMRFIIDPYEGRILRAMRLGPPPMYDRAPRGEDDYVPTLGGSRPVVRDLGEDGPPQETDRARRTPPGSARLRETAPLRAVAPRGPATLAPQGPPPSASQAPPPRPAAVAPPPVAPAPAPVAAPAKPAPAATEPSSAPVAAPAPEMREPKSKTAPVNPKTAAPVAPAPVATPVKTAPAATAPPPAAPATPSPAAVTAPSPAAATAPAPPAPKVKATPSRASAARSTGGGSHRAIVPPTAASGSTVVTPATAATPAPTPAAPATAKTPDSSGKPKAGG